VIALTASAHCIGRCDWSASGDPASVDKAAEKHTRTTRHPTATLARPATAAQRTRQP
jgi:hypothetical protein